MNDFSSAFMFPAIIIAYIGPGLGAGAIAAALGLIGSFFLGVFAVLFYPIKRLIKRFNAPQKVTATDVEKTVDGRADDSAA